MVAPVVVNSIDSAGLPQAVSPTDPMPVSGLISKGEALAAGTAYHGFRVDVVGTTAWGASFVNGNAVSFTPIAGEEFAWDVSTVTPGTGGSGIGYLP